MKSRQLRFLALLMLGISAVWFVHSFPPDQHSFYPRCWLHQHTGLHCPGCGTTRAISHLLHGRISLALQCNAIAVILSPFLTLWLLRQCWLWIHQRPAFILRWSTPAIYATFAVLIVFSILRNIPGETFQFLRPP